MRIGKLGHATLVIETPRITCFMDPVLFDPFESDCNTMDPAMRVDRARCVNECNAIILSHGHMDHFCVRSLAQFDRDCLVLYPRGDELIAWALSELGFTNVRAVSAGQQVVLEDLTLFPTASRVGFPEMGMLFVHEGRSFWNMVDSCVDEAIVGAVRTLVGHPDLVFAKFQPLIESELVVNALGSDFPLRGYEALLARVWDLAPRWVAPGSCGYRYARAEWLNDRGFPVTEQQFARDLREGDPSIGVLHVPHGGTVTIGELPHVDVDGLARFGTRRGGSLFSHGGVATRSRGSSVARRQHPHGDALDLLQTRCAAYFDQAFLHELARQPPVWLERMRRHSLRWQLEVVFPDGASEVRLLDFGTQPLAWQAAEEAVFPKLRTSVTASAVLDLLEGRRNHYSLNFNDYRVVDRMYAVTRGGLVSFGRAGNDEPISRVLGAGADRRYVERLVREVLAEATQTAAGRPASREARAGRDEAVLAAS